MDYQSQAMGYGFWGFFIILFVIFIIGIGYGFRGVRQCDSASEDHQSSYNGEVALYGLAILLLLFILICAGYSFQSENKMFF
jgi:hypothetical protein